MRLLDNVKNPLILLLTALSVLSYLTGDLRAAEKIKAMVSNTATLVQSKQS